MAIYPFTTTDSQERALTWAVAKYNADLTNPGAPDVTNRQFLMRLWHIDHELDALVAALRDARRTRLEQQYEAATAAVKTSVNDALGYSE